MPIPKPKDGEARDDFLSRCMGDSVMNEEYPEQSQRAAVCNAQFSGEEAGMSVAALFRKTSQLDAEIFAAGKWNGYNITLRDLEDIVSSFESLGDYHKVPLKFGHNDKQPMTDGEPALGWVDKIWVDYNQKPEKLMATFTDIPDPVSQAIKKKLYRKVSVELDFGVKHKGKLYTTVLSGVALLGADLPAVNVLADLDAYMTAKNKSSLAFDSQAVFTLNSNFEETNMPLSEKEEKELRAQAAKADTLEAENKKLKDDTAEFQRNEEKRLADEKKNKVQMRRKEIDDFAEKQVTDKKWTPAQREAFRKFTHYNDDDKVLETDLESVKAMFIVDDKSGDATKDAGKGGEDTETPEDASSELVRLTYERMNDKDEDFETASFAVMRANPKLAEKHATDELVGGDA